jgi:hypothetical protein
MKPTVIDTVGDIQLSVQTVTPFIDEGKIKHICPKEFCLLIEGGTYDRKEREIPFSHPVFLDKDGALQLIEELQKFVNTPF